MPEAWLMTRAEFVGGYRVDDRDLAEFDSTSRRVIDEASEGWSRRSLQPVPSARGYYFASIPGRPGDVLLVNRDPDGELDVVGGYVEETLWVARGARGNGLSPELVLEAFDRRGGMLYPVTYTSAGKAAHESAHRLAVQRALREGFRVPAKVMMDYPELSPAGAPLAAPPPAAWQPAPEPAAARFR